MDNKKKLTIATEIFAIISVIASIIFGINQWKKSPSDKSFKFISGTNNKIDSQEGIINFIEGYFDSSMRRDYPEIANYFNYPVERFYDLTNASSDDLKNQLKNTILNGKFKE